VRSSVIRGAVVQRGDELLALYDPDRLWLHVMAYQDELAELGEPVAVELRSGRGEPIRVELTALEVVSREVGSDASGTRVRWILALQGVAGRLRPDQPVQVTMEGRTDVEAVVVPRGAVFDEHSQKVVFVQHAGDQFERRVVELGPSRAGWTAIQQGLDPGERVVTEGVYPLHLATGDIEVGHGHDH